MLIFGRNVGLQISIGATQKIVTLAEMVMNRIGISYPKLQFLTISMIGISRYIAFQPLCSQTCILSLFMFKIAQHVLLASNQL